MRSSFKLAAVALSCLAVIAPAATRPATASVDQIGKWQSLFNGRNLDGWIPKINHHRLGENYFNTFTVSDGILHASQEKYPRFRDEFGYLIYETPFSHYRLRLEYRFVGKDKPGAPSFSARNGGVMFHTQPPESIGLDQPFPVAFEMQLLNGDGIKPRPTAEVCTPGTMLSVNGVATKAHCIPSNAPTFTGEDWVTLELEVHGSKSVIERINGKTVLEYGELRYDPLDLRAMELYFARPDRSTILGSGYIALQSEGHPLDFRNIEIMVLPQDE